MEKSRWGASTNLPDRPDLPDQPDRETPTYLAYLTGKVPEGRFELPTPRL